MADPKNGNGEEDDGSSYQKQVEAKESATMARYSKAKLAFEKAKPTASEESARMADAAKRPAKDVPMEDPAGLLRADHGAGSPLIAQTAEDDDGDGDEGGSEGKGGGDSSGGRSPDLDLDSSDYAPFADAVDTKADKAEQRADAKRTAEQEKAETAETKEKGPETTAKISGPITATTGTKTGASPAGPAAKTGGTSAPSSSGSGGGKSGGTSGPATGPG